MPHGIFTWNELMSRDVEASKAFYAAVVGWTFDAMPMEDGVYWIAKAQGMPVAGLMDMKGVVPAGVPPHWLSYIEVDDVDARIARLEAHGGHVLRAPFDVEGVGRIAVVADPAGAPMGWMARAEG